MLCPTDPFEKTIELLEILVERHETQYTTSYFGYKLERWQGVLSTAHVLWLQWWLLLYTLFSKTQTPAHVSYGVVTYKAQTHLLSGALEQNWRENVMSFTDSCAVTFHGYAF